MSGQKIFSKKTSAEKTLKRRCTDTILVDKKISDSTFSGKKLADNGFTLVDMLIVLSIFVILIGILVPSLNALIDYRATRAAKSIVSGLERMRTEAESRLVAEMKLERKSDGYYISYCEYRGKKSGMVWSDEKKIAPTKTKIEYKLDDYDTPRPIEMEEGESNSLIFTVDRNTGGFRPLQTQAVTTEDVNAMIDANTNLENSGVVNTKGTDLSYYDKKMKSGQYAECYQIIVSGRVKKRTISLEQSTGKVTMTVS